MRVLHAVLMATMLVAPTFGWAAPAVGQATPAAAASTPAEVAAMVRHPDGSLKIGGVVGEMAETLIAGLVLETLAERRVDVIGATVEFVARPARLNLPADADLAIQRLAYQPLAKRFTASVLATSPSAGTQRITVGGYLRKEIDAPVPARPITRGEVITEDDLMWQKVSDRGLPVSVVLDPAAIIGRTARRTLTAGSTIETGDLKRTDVIAKGAAVTLVIRRGNMRLTATGQALDPGDIGDTIRVANAASHTVVTGVVLASGEVAAGETAAPSTLR